MQPHFSTPFRLILLLSGLLAFQAAAQQRYPAYPGYGYPYGQGAPYQPYAQPGQQQPQPGYRQPAAPAYQPRQPAYRSQRPPARNYPPRQQGQTPVYPPRQAQTTPAYPPQQTQTAPAYTPPQQPQTQSHLPPQATPAPTYQPAQRNWPGAPTTTYSKASPQPASLPSGPRIEVRVSDRRPYIQQTLILTLEVISDRNIATLQPKLPGTGNLIFSKLDGPETQSRRSGDRTEIVNRYRYGLTPLLAGEVSVPSIHVSGTLSGSGERFEIASPASILLQVQPAVPGIEPWLPLHGLILQSYLKGADQPVAGSPLSMVVDISAIGASGGQLPSFERALKSSDFHVYREKSDIEGRLSSDGRFLLGHRTEVFTLVPQHGGKVQIPELRINWWNVDTQRAETATVPIRQLVARGEPGSLQGRLDALALSSGDLLLWIPLIGLFSATIGFWILAWLRHKPFIRVVEEELRVIIGFSARRFHDFLIWLAPIRRLQRLRQLFVRSLPRSFRLWFCVRLVDGEDDPAVWAYMLKFLANKHLGLPAQLPLLELGRRLSEIHPRSDPRVMDALMQELDNALYGGGNIDFPSWKQRFRRQLRPTWLPAPGNDRPRPRQPRQHLPDLNPRVS